MRYLVRALSLAVLGLVMASSATLVRAQERPPNVPSNEPRRIPPMPIPSKTPPPRLDRTFEIQPLPTVSAKTYVARVRNKSQSSQKARLVLTMKFSDGKTKTLESRIFHLRAGESTVASVDQSRVPIETATKVSVKVETVRR